MFYRNFFVTNEDVLENENKPSEQDPHIHPDPIFLDQESAHVNAESVDRTDSKSVHVNAESVDGK